MTNKRLSRDGPKPSISDMKRNLLKIQVFYETLSNERLLEYPAYKVCIHTVFYVYVTHGHALQLNGLICLRLWFDQCMKLTPSPCLRPVPIATDLYLSVFIGLDVSQLKISVYFFYCQN